MLLDGPQVLTFRVPPFYSLIVRTLTILEGLALFVDPDFRLIKVREHRWRGKKRLCVAVWRLLATLFTLICVTQRERVPHLRGTMRYDMIGVDMISCDTIRYDTILYDTI